MVEGEVVVLVVVLVVFISCVKHVLALKKASMLGRNS